MNPFEVEVNEDAMDVERERLPENPFAEAAEEPVKKTKQKKAASKTSSPENPLAQAPQQPPKKTKQKKSKKTEEKKPGASLVTAVASKSPRASLSEGRLLLGLAKSTNAKTQGLLVWSARRTIGCPVLVVYKKRVRREEWAAARWSLVRKSTGESVQEGCYREWRTVDRRRLVLAGSQAAVYELVLGEETQSSESGGYYPVRLCVEVAGVELTSKSFFVLSRDALSNLTRKALSYLEKWFMDPDLALNSVVQQRLVRSKSLAAAFLKKHQTGSSASSASGASGAAAIFVAGNAAGVVPKWDTSSELMSRIEDIYPVPVPMDSIQLIISISQVFHFTHESIQWVGDLPEQEKVFSQILMPAGVEFDRDKLHVYGQILPFKGMYQHSNPRLKRPFEVLCSVLKVVLACNGLPRSWLEEDGFIPAEVDLAHRKFASYEEVFLDDTVFNVNAALETLARSVRISKSGALVIDYSVVVPVLVNSLSDLHGHFSRLSSSRLKEMLGELLNELFQVQVTVSELGEELREEHESGDQHMDAAMLVMRQVLRDRYAKPKLHITQAAERDVFVAPAFDLFETTREMRTFMTTDTVLEFDELLQSDLNVFRLCIRGVSGCGKTTVCKRIAQLWSDADRQLFQGKFQLVMLISLDALTTATYQDLEYITLEDVVYREVVRHDKRLREHLADSTQIREWLMRNYSRILWIFDGIEALQQYCENQYSKRNANGIYDALRTNSEPCVRHKIVTDALESRTTAKVSADLYLMLRLFSGAQIEEYVGKFLGEERGERTLQYMEKSRVLSKDYVHVPLNLELVCAAYSADSDFRVSFEQPLALLFEKLYGWLRDASAEEFSREEGEVAQMEQYVLKLAWQSYFKSKFQSPTVTKKLVNQIPRDYRARVSNTMFFELVSKPKGLRFLHPRMQEFMVARYLAHEPLTEEMLARLKVKVVNTSFHGVFYFLVGLLREDDARMKSVFDIVLLEERELVLLGTSGVTFVFKCFEEANFSRAVRKHVISWFWRHFGQPKMQVWRNNFVINLLELLLFKMARVVAVKSADHSIDLKARAVDALARLGVDSPRVVQLLVRAGQTFVPLVPRVVAAIRELSISDRNVIPVLIAGTESDDEQCCVTAIRELQRIIVDPGQVQHEAVQRLLEVGQERESAAVTRAVLDTLSQWRVTDEGAMPILVRALELWDVDVRRSAIAAVQYVDMSGPNVFYSERVFSQLEEIASSSPELRVDVLRAFLHLGMESRFVLATMVECVQEEDAGAIELCGEFHLINPLVIQALVAVVQQSQDQKLRRLAVDIIAFMHLPKYNSGSRSENERIQADINQVIDVLYGYGLSSKFVAQRVQRMAEKKRKSGHLTWDQFVSKYIRG